MTSYDEAIIQKFADDLYQRAGTIVTVYTGVGILLGVVWMTQSASAGFVAAVVLGALGYYIGTAKAFGLRLQAQMALCQVQTERNTRVSASLAES